jgi:hypothetical protein
MLSEPYTITTFGVIFLLTLTVINLIIAYRIDFCGYHNVNIAIAGLFTAAIKTTGLFQVLAINAIPILTIVLIIKLIKFIIYKRTTKKLRNNSLS